MRMLRQYCIAGQVLEIAADFAAESTAELEQFRTEGKTPDFRVCFSKTDRLLPLSQPNISTDSDSMVSVHAEADGIVQAFHEGICGEIFAQAILDYEKKCEQIRYVERGLCQFREMSRCLDWIGIENIYAGLQTLILHAALIDVDGSGILFMGAAGVGKSTRADLWHRYTGAVILNGDRAFINKDENGIWTAYGSPYAGSSGYYVNRRAPIRVVMAVVRGGDDEVCLRKRKGIQAFREVYRNLTVPQWNREAVQYAAATAAELVEEIPVYEMICPPDIRAVEIVRKELKLDG